MEKEIKIVNNVNEITRLADFVDELGVELDLSPEVTMNINLAVEEAVVNIILYAYPRDQFHEIRLKVTASEQQLIFLLSDSGMSFDPTRVPDADVTLPLEERPVGGMGIFLIRKIMNEVTYERIDGENKLTMKKYIE